MPTAPLVARVRARLARDLKRVELEGRRRLHHGELIVNYPWGRLFYSGDGDGQEVAYHQHQAQWVEKDMHVFRSLLAPGQVAVDVGANLGLVSLMFARLVGPEGRVLSFEPSPRVYAKLERLIAINDVPQITPFNFGCGSRSAVERLYQVGVSSGNSSILAGNGDHVDIRIERLDDVPEVQELPVALLKIDTEGYEPEVLRGAQRLISERRPVIYLEMGGDYVDSTRQSIELLGEAGYATDHVRGIDWARVGNGADFFFIPRP